MKWMWTSRTFKSPRDWMSDACSKSHLEMVRLVRLVRFSTVSDKFLYMIGKRMRFLVDMYVWWWWWWWIGKCPLGSPRREFCWRPKRSIVETPYAVVMENSSYLDFLFWLLCCCCTNLPIWFTVSLCAEGCPFSLRFWKRSDMPQPRIPTRKD